MRKTVRIDADLLSELKTRAHLEGLSLTALVNLAIRRGLGSGATQPAATRPYQEQVFSMGRPSDPLHKALMLAASHADNEIVEKLARRE